MRELKEDDLVLIMLPDHMNKLVSKQQDPFRIRRKVGPPNYKVDHPGLCRARQIYHMNLLKKWETHENYLMDPREVGEEWTPETRSDPEGGRSTPVIG